MIGNQLYCQNRCAFLCDILALHFRLEGYHWRDLKKDYLRVTMHGKNLIVHFIFLAIANVSAIYVP